MNQFSWKVLGRWPESLWTDVIAKLATAKYVIIWNKYPLPTRAASLFFFPILIFFYKMFVCVSSHIFAMSLLSNHLFLNNEIYEGKYSDLKLINKLRDRYCEIDLYLDIFRFVYHGLECLHTKLYHWQFTNCDIKLPIYIIINCFFFLV